jgi:SAM-dependent methyltransferase
VKQSRAVERCTRCGLIWVPAGVAIGASGLTIYEEEVPIFAQEGNADYYLDPAQLDNFRDKLGWVRSHLRDGATLLDAGANYGHFLAVASSVYRARGFDISPTAVAWSRAQFGVDNKVASIYELPPDLVGPFEAVASFDVIEHVDDPRRALRSLHAVLAPGGLLFLTTPDAGSLIARLLGARWHYLDPIQHIVLFNRRNLAQLLEENGFEVIAMRTIGHRYRVSYVLGRLCYLHRESLLGGVFRLLRRLARPVAGLSLRIDAGDVMGVVARRSEVPVP